MNALDRAAWIAAFNSVLAIADAYPSIPLPDISTYSSNGISWYLRGDAARQQMATLEQALPCELTGGIDPDRSTHYQLTGTLGGLTVTITALAGSVAEKRVTGTRTVEDVDWVRLPVQDETPESGTQA